jgi:dipeptidyl aminopeptidase/acylaminoacyl peptidase
MLVQRQCVAGLGGESIFQPLWSPQGELYFVSDRSGWWNMYRWQAAADAEPLLPKDAEFGKAQWEFNMATYGFLSTQRLVCAFCQYGVWHLGYIDLHTKRLQTFKMPYTDIKDVRVDAEHRTALIIAGSPTEAHALIQFNLNEIENKGKQLASAPLSLSAAVEQPGTHRVEVLRSSSQIHTEEGYLSVPQEINFPSQDGQRAYAFYYPPRNQDFISLPNEKPPLLVMSHGGPTYATGTALSLKIQFWTSRGFAVVDVNYGGSSGYGRVYRQRLNGKWGIVDVDDCIQAARYLVEQGKADAERLLIRGGSSGGYTTLCAITFHNVFKAAASYYGVSDLESLARDTHKFESHYLHSLIAPYPEEKHIFQERSPLHYIDRLSCPVIFFQGKKDRVVPLDQAERMVEALRHRNVEVEYVLFEQEGHGFRSSEAIQQSLEKEFAFYLRILGIR